MRALVLVLLLAAPALAGCFGAKETAREGLVAYPRLGDVAVYDVRGALLDLARWENGAAFPAGSGRLRFSLDESAPVIDGARAVHPAFRVLVERDSGGGFVTHAERFVSPRHQAVVQAYYPLSQDQGVLSFDERGFPWLFGASALFGADPARDARVGFALPDNLGRGESMVLEWVAQAREGDEWVFGLEGSASLAGELRIPAGSAWPTYARLELRDDALAPHVRSETPKAVLEARLASLAPGDAPLPARDRAATFGEDLGVTRLAWDGEKPPDGDAAYVPYALADAVRDAKLLDTSLAAWLSQAQEPRLYRATFQEDAGPVEGTSVPNWLLQFVDRSDIYYEVEIERVSIALVAQGVPRVVRSAPAEPPAEGNHGWFAREAVREDLVPLSEGVRIVRDVFGAQGVQIFLRSFSDPPGYSYFLDGGFEEDGGRYTVVYHPSTGFIEQATGPVSPRFAEG
jgi:hypothetical protein